MSVTQRVVVRSGTWYDSAVLMRVSQRLGQLAGIAEAVVMMGTPMNRQLLADAGFAAAELEAAGPMDVVVALRAETAPALDAAERELEGLLAGKVATASGRTAGERWRTVTEAAAAHPEAAIVSVAVPGPYAASVAHRALDAGRHVFLFSDNVALEDEVALKRRGLAAGLLVMGPDCGTSILSGVGLGFTNRVPRGRIGLVGPSGTGLQETSCLLARLGEGVSHAIGTGGRDLKAAVGGIMTRFGLELLADDPATAVVVLIAKSPDPDVARTLHRFLAECGKPAIVRYLGQPPQPEADSVVYAASIDEAAARAAALARGEAADPSRWSTTPEAVADEPPHAGRLVGLFSGGSLAAEAREILRRERIQCEVPEVTLGPDRPLPGVDNLVVDLGDDAYTRGRPHPMVDQSVRLGVLASACQDRSVGVVLLDLVLGDGAHPDPAPEWVATLDAVRQNRGDHAPAVVVSLCGTDADPQGLGRQRALLEAAGARVLPSAAQAARLAARLLGRRGTT